MDVFRGQVLPTLQGIFTNAKNVARDRKLLVDQMKTNRWAAILTRGRHTISAFE